MWYYCMSFLKFFYDCWLCEQQINAFIHCFVGVWQITSLYDLRVAICKSEGVEKFEELELGPLLRHPLVLHYFFVNCDKVFEITSAEIITHLCEFLDAFPDEDVKVEEFLDFIARKRSVSSKEKLMVRIQSLGYVICTFSLCSDYLSCSYSQCFCACPYLINVLLWGTNTLPSRTITM